MADWVDLHNHVIPGVDDGARTPEESASALAALHEQGVRKVVATPHIDGSLTLDAERLADRLGGIDAGWTRLSSLDVAPVVVERGVELKLDVPEVDLTDPRLRLAGSRTVLVEFPYMSVPPRSAHALEAIRRSGFVPLLAHPERYSGVGEALRPVEAWLSAGALLQVNAGSLLGQYGREAQGRAFELLKRGWVHCMASDYHSRGTPAVSAARSLLTSWGGEEQARMLFEENPSRLLSDGTCMRVAPLDPRQSLSARLKKMLPWT